jgi:5-methylcytosine-specific restriction enzyme subunit McrC
MLYLATEHSLLTKEPGTSGSSEMALPGVAFEALKAYALRDDAEPILRYFVQHGREYLRVGPYVGLLQATPWVAVEILPKITSDHTPDSIAEARASLLRMLLSVPELFPRPLPESQFSQLARFPLPDVLAGLFLQLAERILHRGLQADYRLVENERPFVKGKLRLSQNPLALVLHPERLPVAYDERTRNNPPNRLLKACLLRLRTSRFARQIRQHLFVLEEIPGTLHWRQDLELARRQGRTFQAYAGLWPWAEWLLGGHAPGLAEGSNRLPGLLFPTQRLFESYVAISLKRYLPPAFRVSVHESAYHLLFDAAGKATHRLQPDVVVRRGQAVWVLDTKWKLIQGNGSHISHLSQADLYQLYAYGQRYLNDTGQTKVGLVYPRTPEFMKAPPPHQYEPHLPLYLLPADLSVSAPQMVEKMWKDLGE